MKKIFVILALIGLSVLFPFRSDAESQVIYEEHISAFFTEIDIASDSSLSVTETIEYDFGNDERHGIYRDIPYAYSRNGASYKLRIDVQSVVDEQGDSYTYTTARSDGNVEIKIGDGDVYISGEYTYVITYTVERAINFFDTHDELFWNVTGNEWNVPIEYAESIVTFPSGATEIQTACYTGAYGDEYSDCGIEEGYSNAVGFFAEYELSSYEGLSVVVGLNKGIIQEPTTWQNIEYFIQDNWGVFIPFIVLLFMHLLWRRKGKDPKGRGTIIPEYEAPEEMTPSLMGTLWDERADTKDITATIIHLATRGFLTVKYISKKNYKFSVLKKPDRSFSKTDTAVWDALFGKTKKSIELSDLKNKFYKDLPKIKTSMYDSLIAHDYYPHNPQTVKGKYWVVAGLFLFLAVFVGGSAENMIIVFSLGFSAVIIGVYGTLMSRKTQKGAIAKEKVEGFKWFLSVTEKDRLEFHNAPEKKPEQFMEFLPFAIVLGVEKKWGNQFKDMYLESPSWYEGQPGNAFTAIYFASAMSSMNSQMNSTFTSRPNSAGSGGSGFGGGGFSGGGFGGGGGGSW